MSNLNNLTINVVTQLSKKQRINYYYYGFMTKYFLKPNLNNPLILNTKYLHNIFMENTTKPKRNPQHPIMRWKQ